MRYDPDALPFWEESNPGPVARHRATIERRAVERACVATEQTIENIRQHHRAGSRLEKRTDRVKLERLRNNYAWLRTKLDAHDELREGINGQR
jgi:hypothetical protein